MPCQLHVVLLYVLVICSLLLPEQGAAEIYEYTDQHGTVNFVDDPGKIPRQYRKKHKHRNEATSDPSSRVTSVQISGNQVLVPVTLRFNGQEVTTTMLLDTGASSTTISTEIAQRLHIGKDHTQAVLNRLANGGIVESRRMKLSSITVGPHTQHGMEINILRHEGPNLGFDGLLGMNFLRNHRYNIDFGTQQIIWDN